MNVAAVNPTTSAITLNGNGPNALIKRRRLSVDQKHYPSFCCLHNKQAAHILSIKTQTLNVNEWRKTEHANTNEKEAGVTILISERADFKVRSKRGHRIMIKRARAPRRHNF